MHSCAGNMARAQHCLTSIDSDFEAFSLNPTICTCMYLKHLSGDVLEALDVKDDAH